MVAVDTDTSKSLARNAASAAENKKATDVVILDVGDLVGITDFFVIASTSNPRQLDTVADEVHSALKADGRAPLRREGATPDGWMVLDYGDVVVHVFTEAQRDYYDLERLWADAPRIEVGATAS
ncbi:MAG TPA: ribosome silencing factor [Euzebyales bacterium]